MLETTPIVLLAESRSFPPGGLFAEKYPKFSWMLSAEAKTPHEKAWICESDLNLRRDGLLAIAGCCTNQIPPMPDRRALFGRRLFARRCQPLSREGSHLGEEDGMGCYMRWLPPNE